LESHNFAVGLPLVDVHVGYGDRLAFGVAVVKGLLAEHRRGARRLIGGRLRVTGPASRNHERGERRERSGSGALGVALLGALLVSGSRHAQALSVPMLAAAAGYLLAVVLAWLATGHRGSPGA
jgi:hypothetical protein